MKFLFLFVFLCSSLASATDINCILEEGSHTDGQLDQATIHNYLIHESALKSIEFRYQFFYSTRKHNESKESMVTYIDHLDCVFDEEDKLTFSCHSRSGSQSISMKKYEQATPQGLTPKGLSTAEYVLVVKNSGKGSTSIILEKTYCISY